MEKPTHLNTIYAQQFQDDSVVQAYTHRPTYPEAIFTRLLQLLPQGPRTILDVGCGRGELARPLAARVDRLDAVDWSEAMIRQGQQLPHGDNPHLHWQIARIEEAHFTPPYALITAGASLQWMNWDIVCPQFAQILTATGLLVLVDQEERGVPWQSALNALIAQFSTNQDYKPYHLAEELIQRRHFIIQGEERTDSIPFQQPVDEYIEAFHSRNGFSRQRMTSENAAEFDAKLRAAVLPFCPNQKVTLQIIGTMQWGRPY